jgi:hypothetical protein
MPKSNAAPRVVIPVIVLPNSATDFCKSRLFFINGINAFVNVR